MKILLTGGTGYIGSHTAVELLRAGHEVILVDNLFNSKPSVVDAIAQVSAKTCTFYRADLLDYPRLLQILQDEHPDAVIHFAGLKAVAESVQKPLYYYETNLLATLNLLKAMQETQVKQLIFSSSATVYGDQPAPQGLSETLPTGQGITNPYGQTKFMIEQIIRDFIKANPNFSATILRYFNPVGADPSGLLGEDPNGIPNNLMPIVAKVYTGEFPQLTIYGNDYPTKDGTCERDFIHVSDLAKGHLAALQHMNAQVESTDDRLSIYNLGTGRPASVLEIVHAFETASGQPLPYIFGSRRSGDLPILFANPQKAEHELAWRAEKTLADAARDTLNFIQHNRSN